MHSIENIFLIRHGQSESNVAPKKFSKHVNSEVHLSDVGKQQSNVAGLRFAQFLKGENFERNLC
jgi:broad specificity phosphatase PhoE